jgi:hypothetical protein
MCVDINLEKNKTSTVTRLQTHSLIILNVHSNKIGLPSLVGLFLTYVRSNEWFLLPFIPFRLQVTQLFTLSQCLHLMLVLLYKHSFSLLLFNVFSQMGYEKLYRASHELYHFYGWKSYRHIITMEYWLNVFDFVVICFKLCEITLWGVGGWLWVWGWGCWCEQRKDKPTSTPSSTLTSKATPAHPLPLRAIASWTIMCTFSVLHSIFFWRWLVANKWHIHLRVVRCGVGVDLFVL